MEAEAREVVGSSRIDDGASMDPVIRGGASVLLDRRWLRIWNAYIDTVDDGWVTFPQIDR